MVGEARAQVRRTLTFGVVGAAALAAAAVGAASIGWIETSPSGISNAFGVFLLVLIVVFFGWLFLGNHWTPVERGRLAAIVALFLAENKLIFWFVLFSWSGLGAAFGPVVLALLFDKRTTGAGVAAGMLGGFLTSIVWVQFFKADAFGLYEAIPGFIVGGLATVIVSRLTGKAA